MCKVVHCKKEPYDIYIGRKPLTNTLGHFGNPFSHKSGTLADIVVNNRDEAVKAYRDWLDGTRYTNVEPARRQWILNNLHLLKDKVLGCWCKPLACHGDVLIQLLNEKYGNR